jgi:multiple sugar transport system permease protein
MKLYLRREHRSYLLMVPVILLIITIFAYPFIRTFILGFYKISFGASEVQYVGLNNFKGIIYNQAYWQALTNSLYWTFGNISVQLSIPLFLAILLNKRIRGINFARAIITIPWVVPAVTIAVCMRWMLLPKIGIINEMLESLNILKNQIHFLGHRLTAMPTLILLNSWKFLPFGTLMILAALQTIPDETYEAAEVDGASGYQKFRYITLPLVGSMIWFVGFLAFSWNFNTFDLIWLTTQGGPGTITQTLPVLIYRTAFKTFRLGEASAMSVTVAILLIIIGVFYFKYLTPKE